MTDKDISKYGEIQYLNGRLDELFKSFDILIDVKNFWKKYQRQKIYQKSY